MNERNCVERDYQKNTFCERKLKELHNSVIKKESGWCQILFG